MKQSNHNSDGGDAVRVYWRVEGSLLELTTVRPIAFFTWNGQTFIGRWMRRGSVLLMALLRPFLYASNRVFATRVVHSVLRGVSRDRLDLLGEEYFQYKLKPQLKPDGVRGLKELIDSGAEVVLVSQGLDHVMAPLARHLGAKLVIASREVARLDLKLAQETLQLMQSRFEQGRVTLRDIEQARLDESDKWVAFLDADFARQQGQLALLQATGQLAKVFQ